MTDFDKINDEMWRKYGSDWENDERYISYCIRKLRNHLEALEDGEDIDKPSGVSHLSKIEWWVWAIRYNLRKKPYLDDR